MGDHKPPENYTEDYSHCLDMKTSNMHQLFSGQLCCADDYHQINNDKVLDMCDTDSSLLISKGRPSWQTMDVFSSQTGLLSFHGLFWDLNDYQRIYQAPEGSSVCHFETIRGLRMRTSPMTIALGALMLVMMHLATVCE